MGEVLHKNEGWGPSLALIGGGGVCAVVQAGTVATRAASSGTTGGLGNFAVSSLELVASVVVTLLAIVLPIVCLIGVVWICYRMIRAIVKSPAFRRRWESAGSGE